jgi:hypothetical protein
MTEFPKHTFDWRLREHAHVIRLLVRERLGSGWWRVFRWVVIFVLAAAAAAAVGSLLLGDLASASRLLVLGLLVGVLTFRFPELTGWLRAWQVSRIDPAVKHPISHVLEESGLRILTNKAETHIRWEGLKKVRETSDLFMFYYSDRIAFYLPKRVLEGEADVAMIRRLVQERLPPEVPYQDGWSAAKGRAT